MAIIAAIVSAMKNCASRIHGRRRPSEGRRIASVIGPQRNLKDHGSVLSARIEPISPVLSPSFAR